MIAGVWTGRSSHTRIRADSFAVLLVTVLVPYMASRDWTRESSGMVGRSIHTIDECELLMTVMGTLDIIWDIVGH